MPTKIISIRVDEDFPLSGEEVKKLVKVIPLLFAAVKKKRVNIFFGERPLIKRVYDSLVLWLIKKKIISEEALK